MSYRIARDDDEDGPWPVFERVMEYGELGTQAMLASVGIRWAFVFRSDPDGWRRGQKSVLGTATMPGVNGALSKLFDQLLEDAVGYWPDFLITLNEAYWESASDREREILVFHELKHCGQAIDKFGAPKFDRRTGAPVIGMIEHDVEEFNDVVARYGAWKSDLVDFLEAVDAGPQLSNSKVRDAPDLAALADAVMASVEGHELETVEDAEDLANRILGLMGEGPLAPKPKPTLRVIVGGIVGGIDGADLVEALEVEAREVEEDMF